MIVHDQDESLLHKLVMDIPMDLYFGVRKPYSAHAAYAGVFQNIQSESSPDRMMKALR